MLAVVFVINNNCAPAHFPGICAYPTPGDFAGKLFRPPLIVAISCPDSVVILLAVPTSALFEIVN